MNFSLDNEKENIRHSKKSESDDYTEEGLDDLIGAKLILQYNDIFCFFALY